MLMRMMYDEKLAQAAYLLGCQRTGEAIVVDPERDVDRYIDLARKHGLKLTAVAETHIHADFLSGARELAERIGATVYVSDEGDADWKYQWLNKKSGGGSYKHQLLKHGDTFRVGGIELEVVHTPGHTPEHIAFLVVDRGSGADEPMAMITGDFIFVGDLGRPDLLETAAGKAGAREPSAKRLYETVKRLEDLPDFLQVWPAHGAGSACGKALGAVPTSTLGYERRFNSAIRAATSEKNFVDFILAGQPEPPLYFARMKRDNKLGPKVLGKLPQPARLTHDDLNTIDATKVAVIDTRPWNDFRTAHLPGSLFIRLVSSFPSDAGSFVREDEAIYLIVGAERVEEAVRDLVRIGLDDIRGWTTPEDLDAYLAESGRRAMIDEVSPEKAAEILSAGTMQPLDVRRQTEYDEGHIADALNIAHTRLADRLNELPQGEPLLVNCRSGYRSAMSSSLLKRAGRDATNLAGGYLAWEKSQADRPATASAKGA